MSGISRNLLLAGCLVASASAQKVMIKSFLVEPDGKMTVHQGQTISKKGVVVGFESYLDASKKGAGFKLAEPDTKGLEPGDQIYLFVAGLKRRPGEMRDYGSTLGLGAWVKVTFRSLQHTDDAVVITFDEAQTLESGAKIRELAYTIVDGFLMPAAAKPASATPAP